MKYLFPILTVALAFVSPGRADAQLNLTLVNSFVDVQAGGNGNIGVTQEEAGGRFYVIDFSNSLTVHEFDSAGVFLSQFATTSCAPSAPSPNDISWDPDTDTLWVVDNNGPVVLNISRTGTCLGGFSFTGTVPTGIYYDRITKSLFVSETGGVQQLSLAGATLAGGFLFTPPTGSAILAGVTQLPSSGNFLVVSSGGSAIYEVTPAGSLVSTTDLTPFGIGNTQGLCFNQASGNLIVVDNTLSTVFEFSLPCGGATPYGAGCAGSGGFAPALSITGCAMPGQPISINVTQGLGGSSAVLMVSLASTSAPLDASCTLLVQPSPLTISFPLGGVAPGAGSASLPTVLPVGLPPIAVFLQAFVADPAKPSGFTATNGVKLQL